MFCIARAACPHWLLPHKTSCRSPKLASLRTRSKCSFGPWTSELLPSTWEYFWKFRHVCLLTIVGHKTLYGFLRGLSGVENFFSLAEHCCVLCCGVVWATELLFLFLSFQHRPQYFSTSSRKMQGNVVTRRANQVSVYIVCVQTRAVKTTFKTQI